MAKFTNTPVVAVAPSIPQERIDQILNDLIAKVGPENPMSEVPKVLDQILITLKGYLPVPAPAPVEVKRKKRAPNANGYRAIGWPAGIGRKEYLIWKEMQMAAGRVEGLNPQTYKVERDAGGADIETLVGGTPADSALVDVARTNQEFDDELNARGSDIEQELFAHVGAQANGVTDSTVTLEAELNKATESAKASNKSGGGKKAKVVNAGKGVESVLPA